MPLIKLYANLRNLAGTKEVSVPGVTVGAALDILAERYPPLREAVLDKGGLRPHIVVTLNGHNVLDLNLPVTEQDVVAVFPPIAGG
jgi:MoaD family protein